MMQVLEKILQEIDKKIEVAQKIIVEPPHDELDRVANETAECFIEAYKECQDIIRSHMEDEGPAQDSEYVCFEDDAGVRTLRLSKEEKKDEI